jgi:hypothetical protein
MLTGAGPIPDSGLSLAMLPPAPGQTSARLQRGAPGSDPCSAWGGGNRRQGQVEKLRPPPNPSGMGRGLQAVPNPHPRLPRDRAWAEPRRPHRTLRGQGGAAQPRCAAPQPQPLFRACRLPPPPAARVSVPALSLSYLE